MSIFENKLILMLAVPSIKTFRIILLSCTFLLYCLPGYSRSDTLWVGHQKQDIYIRHIVKENETILSLAKQFNAPPSSTAYFNDMSYQDSPRPGSILRIPIGKYNYLRINSVVESKPLFYKVGEGERLRNISRLFNVAQATIERWNQLPMPEVFAGQALKVGWVKYTNNASQPREDANKRQVFQKDKKMQEQTNGVIIDTFILQDEERQDTFSTAYEREFHSENDGRVLEETSGAVVFYSLKTTMADGVYFALFDDAPRGAIISIFNPSSQKVIYAKVVGALPKIGMYHNAKIGLSSNAARILGAKTERTFCKIKY